MDMYQVSWWMQNHFRVGLQHYADDSQLFIALSPRDQSSKVMVSSVHAWFCFNGLDMNLILIQLQLSLPGRYPNS